MTELLNDWAATMDDAVAAMSSAPPASPVGGAPLRVGVDLGTAFTVLFVLDEHGRPLAGAYERTDVVRDGVVVDFAGAVEVLRGLRAQVERRLGTTLACAQGAYPPGVPQSEVRAVRYVIEGADLQCTGLVDEPSAANAVLRLSDGVIVDVGGGTTGVAVVQDGRVVHTADSPTGGTHLTLVIAGAHHVDIDRAESMKCDPARQPALLPDVRPVMEKVATIVARATAGYPVTHVHLVGGSVAFPGFADVVSSVTGWQVTVPPSPLLVTPLGIAASAPAVAGGPS